MAKQAMIRWVLGVALAAVALVFGFFWDEARKEVVYLCANFQAGDTEDSVMRQLHTANLLRIASTSQEGQTLVTADSLLNFGVYRCEVRNNQEGRVIEVESP